MPVEDPGAVDAGAPGGWPPGLRMLLTVSVTELRTVPAEPSRPPPVCGVPGATGPALGAAKGDGGNGTLRPPGVVNDCPPPFTDGPAFAPCPPAVGFGFPVPEPGKILGS